MSLRTYSSRTRKEASSPKGLWTSEIKLAISFADPFVTASFQNLICLAGRGKCSPHPVPEHVDGGAGNSGVEQQALVQSAYERYPNLRFPLRFDDCNTRLGPGCRLIADEPFSGVLCRDGLAIRQRSKQRVYLSLLISKRIDLRRAGRAPLRRLCVTRNFALRLVEYFQMVFRAVRPELTVTEELVHDSSKDVSGVGFGRSYEVIAEHRHRVRRTSGCKREHARAALLDGCKIRLEVCCSQFEFRMTFAGERHHRGASGRCPFSPVRLRGLVHRVPIRSLNRRD